MMDFLKWMAAGLRGHHPVYCADCGAFLRYDHTESLPTMDGRYIDVCTMDCVCPDVPGLPADEAPQDTETRTTIAVRTHEPS
jgi:hypothetical protein